LIGSLTSAVVVGAVLLAMNQAGTVYTKKNLPKARVDVKQLTTMDHVRTGQYLEDTTSYYVLLLGKREKVSEGLLQPGQPNDIEAGRYLVNAEGVIVYRCDPAVNGTLKEQDNGEKVNNKFDAPKTELIALIIDGILDRQLPWNLVLLGVLIALTLELSGVPALPFAVGVYLPLSSSFPVFLGGAVRWIAEKLRPSSDDAGDSSPGVLLGSGYIAGASIATVIVAFLEFVPGALEKMSMAKFLEKIPINNQPWIDSNLPTFVAFGLLMAILLIVGSERFGKKS
ncbi:MAG: OPT/YSL family transporter, partial [Gemmataceae bacterium]